MTQPSTPSIREVLLTEIKAQEPTGYSGQTLQQKGVLDAAARKLGANQNQELQQAILTQWGELFRTGLLAWGLNLANPNSPFFHLTERGRQALQNVTRDPSNPVGYLRHLASIATLEPVAMSYLAEGLECYVAGLFKASGGWRTLPLHPNERISFYGCRTLRFLKGPGLDAALLLNLCDNHRFIPGHGTTGIPPTHQSRFTLRACQRQDRRDLARSAPARPHPSVCTCITVTTVLSSVVR
jgi:hypothetical protein